MRKMVKTLCLDLIDTDWKWYAAALASGAFFIASPYFFPKSPSEDEMPKKGVNLEGAVQKFRLLSTVNIGTNDIYRIEICNPSTKRAY